MTREEQIIEEAKNRFSDDQIYPASKMYAFVAGAKWADRCPNPDTIRKVFDFALNNTNFLIAYNLDAIDWDKLVKQAMKE